jgi:hypothetical protein
MATFVVSSGQTSSGLTINSGDTRTVQSGGTAIHAAAFGHESTTWSR